jgi:Gpi18-like mannosyltransferase
MPCGRTGPRSASSAISPVRLSATGGRAASDSPSAGWSRADKLIVLVAVVAGTAIRLWLLPATGLRDDLDQFVGWVHHIATEGLSTLYGPTEAGPVSFGPVMAYIWGALSAIQPGFTAVTDGADPATRILMKLPATLADYGIAALIWYALRDRPRWAAIGIAAVMLHPVVFYVSAWWGQYESIFMLSGLGAAVAAASGRNGLAAALVAASLMTKPQAIPFLIPFAAWFWATGGIREVGKAALIGLVVIVTLWVPFIPADGPAFYLRSVGEYSSGVFAILSLRAWNSWWLLQEAAARGDFIRDDVAFFGPLALRHVGYLVTAVLSILIAAAVVRDPSPRRLFLALAASSFVFFTFMTQMHERYAYAAFILMIPLLVIRAVRWIWLIFGTVLMLNLFSAVPATVAMQELLPKAGTIPIIGSVILTGCCTATLLLVIRRRDPEPT